MRGVQGERNTEDAAMDRLVSLLLCSLLSPLSLADEGEPPDEPGADDHRLVQTQVAVVPGVGLNASPDVDVDGLAVSVYGRNHNMRGVDLSLGLNWTEGEMNGAQLALFGSVAAQEMRGVQGSTFFGLQGGGEGLQASGLALGTGNFQGVQSGWLGAYNAGDFDGLQVGTFAALTKGSFRGVSASAFATAALGEYSQGAQLSMGLNYARGLEGAQIGLLNIGGSVRGAQVGLLNIGGHVKGAQVGLINVAKRLDGPGIGLASFSGNGILHLDVWTSESAIASAGLKFGSQYMYTIVGAGLVQPNDDWWTFGGGFGGHIPAGDLWIESDLTAWGVATGNALVPGVHTKLRATAGLPIAERFTPIAGVSLNAWAGEGTIRPRATGGLPSSTNDAGRVVFWPGMHAGVQF
jgi:hypothetical protein